MTKLGFLACLLLLNTAMGSTTKAVRKEVPAKGNPKAKLGTSFRFDGSTLRGKYQTSLGTNATVENDKYLDDLLAGRKSMEDRIQADGKKN